jgi:hypothetical protein
MAHLSNRPPGFDKPPPFSPKCARAGYNRCMKVARPLPKPGENFPWIRASASVAILFCLTVLLSACRAAQSGTFPAVSEEIQSPTPTVRMIPAVPDDLPPREETLGPIAGMTPSPSSTERSISTETPLPFGSCTNGLTFMGDLTYPDRTKVLPGQPLEKRWKVRNSGSCDWGPEYRYRWTGGTRLADRDEFALYPAAAGSEAEIVVAMIAPAAPGEYTSDWRAFSPLGVPFGDALYIDIIVAG